MQHMGDDAMAERASIAAALSPGPGDESADDGASSSGDEGVIGSDVLMAAAAHSSPSQYSRLCLGRAPGTPNYHPLQPSDDAAALGKVGEGGEVEEGALRSVPTDIAAAIADADGAPEGARFDEDDPRVASAIASAVGATRPPAGRAPADRFLHPHASERTQA